MSTLQERARIIKKHLQSILARRAAAGGISPPPPPLLADDWRWRIWELEGKL